MGRDTMIAPKSESLFPISDATNIISADINIFAILNKVNSLAELLTLSVEDIEEILGSKQNAADLYESLHGKLKPVEEGAEVKRPVFGSKAKTGKSGSRFKSMKK